MNNDKLVDAIGMISDDKIQNAKNTTAKVYKFSYRKAIALIAAIILKETQNPESFRGGGGKEFDFDSRSNYNYLIPLKNGLLKPVDGVTITNMGFIDDKLHIFFYEDF